MLLPAIHSFVKFGMSANLSPAAANMPRATRANAAPRHAVQFQSARWNSANATPTHTHTHTLLYQLFVLERELNEFDIRLQFTLMKPCLLTPRSRWLVG